MITTIFKVLSSSEWLNHLRLDKSVSVNAKSVADLIGRHPNLVDLELDNVLGPTNPAPSPHTNKLKRFSMTGFDLGWMPSLVSTMLTPFLEA